MNKEEFLELLQIECELKGVQLLLSDTEQIPYIDTSDMMVSGYFLDSPPTLACAIGKPMNEWIEILVHESCHMDQWSEDSRLWESQTINEISSDVIMDEWLTGKEYTKKMYTFAVRTMQDLEIDCEKRSIDKIIKLDLPIDVKRYIQKANSYLYFYSIILSTKQWYDIPPYTITEILDVMPDVFLTNEEYYNTSDTFLNLYKEKCYK